MKKRAGVISCCSIEGGREVATCSTCIAFASEIDSAPYSNLLCNQIGKISNCVRIPLPLWR
ncbi:hypothetical protein HanXRQr2_Chr16g0730161 [Helianthus annuus]|uniref:Uncharacterized protein n=1 Tax=Helianthus annuus TaxID=4232 RepID=A0A9K3DND5_HELAN|nr:hypothetical protein HanXRQr2_Chr16g0730161 [Helianthus annuus]